MPDDVDLSPDERAELERLRAEVADLRSQVAAAPDCGRATRRCCRRHGRDGSGGAQWWPPC